MRIACISDLHLTGIFYDDFDLVDEFLCSLADYGVDHLLVCGDIVGTLEHPERAVDLLELRSMLKRYGWYHPRRCTILPGNHDVRWLGNIERDDIRALRQRMPKLFRGNKAYNRNRYIVTKVLRSTCIIGLDTASDIVSAALSSGEVGEGPLEELQRLQGLSPIRDRYVILAMHHGPQEPLLIPPLEDREAFWQAVDREVVDLIICGHEHKNWRRPMRGVRVACVGGFADEGECLVIDVDDSGRGTSRWLRVHAE